MRLASGRMAGFYTFLPPPCGHSRIQDMATGALRQHMQAYGCIGVASETRFTGLRLAISPIRRRGQRVVTAWELKTFFGPDFFGHC